MIQNKMRFAIVSMLLLLFTSGQLSEIYRDIMNDRAFATDCSEFSKEVLQAINKYAVTEHLDYGKIYAYEVDGFGNKVFIDDPNIPSLIAMKYLIDGEYYQKDVYLNTRKYLLSLDNPYYFKGAAGEGQGGPHGGLDTIWPMGIILRAIHRKMIKKLYGVSRNCMVYQAINEDA